MSESKALTVQERAKAALVISQTEEQLKSLAVSTKDIKTVTNADGREQVHAAIMVLKNTRCEIEKLGKQAREDATKFSKAVIAEENRLIALISSEEDRLEALRDKWDAEIEAEKQRKIDAELKRVEDIQRRIAAIREFPDGLQLRPASEVQKKLDEANAFVIDESFAEFSDTAKTVLAATILAVKGIHFERVNHEAEQAKIAAERVELEKLRKEQAERERVERERIAAEEKAAKALRDAEAAKQAEELRKLREEHERMQREANEKLAAERKAQQEENARIEAAQAAEARKIAAERAELERQQREARETKEREDKLKAEQARIANIKRPTDDEIVSVLSSHYNVPTKKVIAWLATYRNQEAA